MDRSQLLLPCRSGHIPRMRKRWKWLILVGCAALVCILTLTFRRNHEPSYNGRTLSEWVAIYGGSVGDASNIASPADRQLAANAIRNIGINALPYLLDWMDATTSWHEIAAHFAERPPAWIIQHSPLVWVPGADALQVRTADATVAFGALGAIGAPAIPELTRRANLTNTPSRREAAILALSFLEPSVAPHIKTIISNREPTARVLAVTYIRSLGTNAQPFVPLLIGYLLTNNNGFATTISARTLGELKLDPDLAVPALTKSLADPRAWVRLEASRALIEFGEFARPALPALSIATNDPDPNVRASAAEAIRRLLR
jgi:hypothetical protein